MRLISEVKAYTSLSSEQKQFVKAKLLEGERTPDEWLSFFGRVAEFDTYVDAGRKTLKVGWAAMAVLFVVGIILMGLVGPILLIVAIVGAIAMGITAFVQSRVDLPNNFRGLAFPLVSILKEEMDPGERLYLHLDLLGKTISEKENRPARRSTPSGNERFFEDQWMTGSAMLADGSRLEWSIVDHVRERKRTKRSASGKTKTKTKYKIKTVVEARLGFRQKEYAAVQAQSATGGHEKVDIKPGESRNTVRVRRVVVSSDLDAVLDLSQVLEAVGHCYAQVRLNKPSAN